MSDLQICVLGAGIVGLTTTLELTRNFSNASITLIADNFLKNTTSYVAAGIFRPTSGDFGKTEEISRQWINDSYSYWEQLRVSTESYESGVKDISGYIFSSEHAHIVRNKYLEKLVPIYRKVTEEELNICPGNWKYGSYFKTLLIDTDKYMKWASAQIRNSNVKVQRKKIVKLFEISRSCNLLINCTGLGAKQLFQDSSMVAIRGQVSKVEAPWIKHFFYGDYDTYIIPGFDSVTLGGCRQYESYNMEYNKYDYASIRERCEKMLPSLRDARLIEHRVGLRPHRIPVRVEKEEKNIGGKKLKIIHNYGHGGYGVTTCPGTSKNAVELVKQAIRERSKL